MTARVRSRRGRWPGDPKPPSRKRTPKSAQALNARRRSAPEHSKLIDAIRELLGLAPLQRHRRKPDAHERTRQMTDLPPALAGNGEKLRTAAEWLAECARVERCRAVAGLPASGAMLTLHMKSRRSLRRSEWSGVAVMDGVRGRVIGEIEPRCYLIEVRAADVRASLSGSEADR